MIRIKDYKDYRTGRYITQYFQFNQDDALLLQEKNILCNICKEYKIKKVNNKWVGRCKNCLNVFNFFYPFPIQELVSQISNRIIFNLGGVGCGKTTTSAMIISDTMRTIPGVPIFALSQSLQQLEKTAKEELDKFFLKNEFEVKNEKQWKLKNGSSINWYTSDDEQKIKGVNAGMIWLIEASKIKYSVFKEVLSRMRNDLMKVYEKDQFGNIIYEYDPKYKKNRPKLKKDRVQIIVESNPSTGWIRDYLLFRSKAIFYTNSVRGIDALKKWTMPAQDPESDKILDIVSIMQASVDNPIMTEDYFSTLRAKANSKEEFDRDVYCDMTYQTGLVYGEQIVNGKLIPKDELVHNFTFNPRIHKWIESIDPGGAKKGNDPTSYGLFIIEDRGAFNLPLIIAIDGFLESGLDYGEVARRIWTIRDKHNWKPENSLFFVSDPSSKKTTWKHDTYISDMEKMNIYLDPQVDNDILHGINRVKTFINNDAFKIPRHLDFIWDELLNYEWEEDRKRNFSAIKKRMIKPKDKDNHSMDMMRYLIMKVYISPNQVSKVLKGEEYFKDLTYRNNANIFVPSRSNRSVINSFSGSPMSFKRKNKLIV